jgi:hypothetical protein
MNYFTAGDKLQPASWSLVLVRTGRIINWALRRFASN